MEESLRTEKIQVERKQFFFDLKENPRGRFLRITEDVNGRRDTIIVPATGLDEFRRALEQMIAYENETKSPPPTKSESAPQKPGGDVKSSSV